MHASVSLSLSLSLGWRAKAFKMTKILRFISFPPSYSLTHAYAHIFHICCAMINSYYCIQANIFSMLNCFFLLQNVLMFSVYFFFLLSSIRFSICCCISCWYRCGCISCCSTESIWVSLCNFKLLCAVWSFTFCSLLSLQTEGRAGREMTI